MKQHKKKYMHSKIVLQYEPSTFNATATQSLTAPNY